MALRRQIRLPAAVPPFVLGLLGIVVILQQTFLASVDRPWLLGAGLTLVGIPVFWHVEPPGTPPVTPPPVVVVPPVAGPTGAQSEASS